MSNALISIDDVRAAARAIHGKVANTPFLHSQTLSELTGAEIWLKFENLQFTGSFKQRGALNKLLSLTPRQRANGVVTVSAGNHAQGVAYHAGQLGIPATIRHAHRHALGEGTAYRQTGSGSAASRRKLC